MDCHESGFYCENQKSGYKMVPQHLGGLLSICFGQLAVPSIIRSSYWSYGVTTPVVRAGIV